MTDIFPESREEEILVSTINGEEYDKAPESRIEALLLELKEVIEEGGGGGGTTNYNLLQNKPSINSVTLTGDKSLEDLNIPTASDLAGKQDVLPVTASENDVIFNGDIQDGQGNTLSVLAEALTKTASGNPVVIDDCAGGKARSLKTTIGAIQDLHGYDHPWAGGAGKNKLHNTLTTTTINGVTFTVNNDGTVTASGTATGAHAQFQIPFSGLAGNYYFDGCPSGGAENKYDIYVWDVTTNARVKQWDGTSSSISDFDSATLKQIQLPSEHNFILAIRVFNGFTANNLVFKPMICASTETDPTFAPWENKCPISGRTEARVDDVGKNLYGGEWGNITDLPFTIPSGTVMTLSCKKKSSINVTIDLFRAGETTRFDYWTCSNDATSRTFTIIDDLSRVRLNVAGDQYSQVSDIQLEIGSSATPYEPYAHSSATIQLGQTVYGGEVNFDTGVVTVTHAIVTDMSTLVNWSYQSNNKRFYSGDLASVIKPCAYSVVANAKCSGYNVVSVDDVSGNNDAVIGVGPSPNNYVFIRNLACTTSQQLISALSGIQFCYELATPTTLQLTPTQLQLLKGYNRVTIDNGTITLDYVAKAISGNDEEIAPLVGDKATKSYAVNDFIERADGLYRVTAPIASGASFTDNNTVKMSIGEALTYLYNK